MNKIRVAFKYLFMPLNWYMSAWWKPLVLLSVVLIITCTTSIAYKYDKLTVLFFAFLTLLGFAVGIVHFYYRNIGRGICVWLGTFVFLYAFFFIHFSKGIIEFIESRDTFADNLELPEGINLEVPRKKQYEWQHDGLIEDISKASFTAQVVSSVGNGAKLASRTICRIPALEN